MIEHDLSYWPNPEIKIKCCATYSLNVIFEMRQL